VDGAATNFALPSVRRPWLRPGSVRYAILLPRAMPTESCVPRA
jgi:hypothetical protein